jgi:hypothetical protein
MKNTITVFVSILFASLVLSGCSSDPKDIKLSDLKSACDYVDAAEKIIDATIDFGKNKDLDNLSKEDKKEIKALQDKIEEIGEAAEKKYTRTELNECKSFERIKEKAEDASKIFEAL